jgi:indolepyruvate ferredoxin oxidoreductase
MSRQDVTLADRYDLTKGRVLLNGTQALVRLMLTQRARDLAAGHNTAGYVTGYRGSPLGAVDMQMVRAKAALDAAHIRFQPGLNEDLAATALWGTQQAELRGEGRYDGVYGLWYGKGPGVDRSGDAFRHANLAGTSRLGGVLAAFGDDHTGESSTTCHQSDYAAVDAQMPLLSPAGVQEIIDFGLYGYALSRYSGLWVALKLMKDTVEATAVVDGRRDRMSFVTPDHILPPDGLNIRRADFWGPQEARMSQGKRPAALAFARANRIDARIWGRPGARIGFVAAGKNWLDLVHALSLLDIDAAEADRFGLTTYKLGQIFPIEMQSFREWADGLDLVVVVEEKRKLIESQIKEGLYGMANAPRIWGGRDGAGQVLFPEPMQLDPADVARKLAAILTAEGRNTERLQSALSHLTPPQDTETLAARQPYFCAGCPHNTSTKVPAGSRAVAGIGCHTLAVFMDRSTEGWTHMGAEGASWVGEAPFSTRDHIFQNMGDGTFNHSGLLAIRFAVAAQTTITYKILFNDAVALTGGQGNDGDMTAEQVAREVLAAGVKTVALVHDPAEGLDLSLFPPGITIHTRDELPAVQERMIKCKGVSVILYVQTCAAEKRRRRKKGAFTEPDKRVFINTDICEGCGDCGIQSNCVAITPVETEFGRKRAIDQSSCNKDFSCIKGFCPAFVTVEGAVPRKSITSFIIPGLPEPLLPTIHGTHNIIITGIGGTGVVTIGAVLAMAGHLDGKGAAMIEMAGLSQKGGAVNIHCRLANTPADISAVRVSQGECDTLLGCDLVVAASAPTLSLMRKGRTQGILNTHETMTGAFTRDGNFRLPTPRMTDLVIQRIDNLTRLDAAALALSRLGDSIYANQIVLGAAWQQGLIPLSEASITSAIRLNGADVDQNLRAFALGRWAATDPEGAAGIISNAPQPSTLKDKIVIRANHLSAYQNATLAARYCSFVARFADPSLQEAVAKGYHKLLACKDEYEVARLLAQTPDKVGAAFEGTARLTYHLAPPLLSRTAPDGRPLKRALTGLATRLFPLLARLKTLRGTPFDPFGRTAERRLERALITQYEKDMEEVLTRLTPGILPTAIALAKLPLSIKGFGPVKEAAAAKAAAEREVLLATLRAGGPRKEAAA